MTVLKMYNGNGYENKVSYPVYTFSNLMNNFFNQKGHFQGDINRLPKANIVEEKTAFILSLAIPGLNKSDINMEVDKDILRISRKSGKLENNDNYYRIEYDFGDFERTFQLPDSADIQKIKAKYENGILRVEIPKKKDAIDNGPIEIKIS